MFERLVGTKFKLIDPSNWL